MARPQKRGLSYFPFDVDFFSDKKIKRLRAKFGNDGVSVYIYILCEIYRNGYYTELDEDLVLDISDELNISENSTTQILNYLLSRSLFNDILAKSVKVLTAASVQRRYQEAKKGNKTDIEVERKFWVLKEEETLSFIKLCPVENKSGINSGFSGINPSLSEINPINKSKVNKSKVNKTKSSSCKCTEDEDEQKQHPVKNCDETYFNRFWNAYPKKEHRLEAFEQWRLLSPDNELLEIIINAVINHTQSEKWNQENGKYIPLAENWLKNKRWEDVLRPVKSSKKSTYDINKIFEYSKNNIPDFED